MKKRRSFSQEFKREASGMVLDHGVSYREVCRQLDLGETGQRHRVEQLQLERVGDPVSDRASAGGHGARRQRSRRIAMRPNNGPISNHHTISTEPSSTNAETQRIDPTEIANPRLFCIASALPTSSGAHAFAESAENCAESATTKNPQMTKAESATLVPTLCTHG